MALTVLTDTDRIEKAAKAIHDAFANRSGRALPWEKIRPALRMQYRREAKAALVAVGSVYATAALRTEST